MKTLREGEVTLGSFLDKILPTQEKFLKSKKRFGAMYGGVGAGKTAALCAFFLLLGQRYPGSAILLGRSTVPALRDTTRKTFLEMCPAAWADGDLRVMENMLRFRNGSEFFFRHLDLTDPAQRKHLLSMNLNGVGIDEASEVQEEVFTLLQGRTRRRGLPHYIRAVSNPNGQDWGWRLFFDPNRPEYWKRNVDAFVVDSRENVHLPGDYIENIMNWPDDWRERMVHGSFADFSETIYKEFDTRLHVYDCTVPHDFFGGHTDPPPDWPTYVGIDIGGADCWGFTFYRVAPNGMIFVYDEIRQSGILIEELAGLFFQKLGGSTPGGVAYDWENKQASYEMEHLGFPALTPAVKAINAGIFSVAHYLHPRPGEVNPFTGQPPSPKLFFASRCHEHTTRMLLYKRKKNRLGITLEDPDDRDMDNIDSLRYGVHTFHPAGFEVVRPPEYMVRPDLDEFSRLYWHDVAKQEERLKSKRKKPFRSAYGFLRGNGIIGAGGGL